VLYYCYKLHISVFTSAIVRVVGKTIFKMHSLKMFYWLLESQMEEWITYFGGKLKLNLNRFQQYFNFPPPPPHPPTLPAHSPGWLQLSWLCSESKTTLKPGLHRCVLIIHSTVPFCIFLKLCGPTSDLLAHYSSQAQTSLMYLVYSPVQTQILKWERQ
jgi:hypothetical protein